MIALDTNLLVRLYVDDGDPQSVRQRAAALRICHDSKRLFVPKTVLLEFEWVLRGFYKFDRASIARALAHLLGLPNINVESENVALEALAHYQKGFDFADALHLASSSDCDKLLSFDKRFVSRAARLKTSPVVEAAK